MGMGSYHVICPFDVGLCNIIETRNKMTLLCEKEIVYFGMKKNKNNATWFFLNNINKGKSRAPTGGEGLVHHSNF